MKKIICIFTVCLCVISTSVSAASLEEMTKKVMDYFKIEVTEDVSGISKLQNRRSISNPELFSAAINNGIVIARNGLVNDKGTDYTPLINGLIKKYINNNNYRFVSGQQVDLLRNKNIVFTKSTVFVTEAELNYTDIYTCIVNRDNEVVFVWKSNDIKQPELYRVKLYWAEDNELIVTQVYRKEYDQWLKESKDDFYSLDISGVNVSETFIMENLDKYIYVFADGYGDKVVVKGIGGGI